MNAISRRRILQSSALGLLGASSSGWMPAFANALGNDPDRRRHCVLLWMTGGPSQTDTFDTKPDHENGGEFEEIATAVPGLWFSEHLPKLAKMAKHLAVIRSLSTKEGDHSRGTYLMRTGHQPGGPIQFPTLGSLVSKELGVKDAQLPNFVSISPYQSFNSSAYRPGFLGPKYASLSVSAKQQTTQQLEEEEAFAQLGVADLRDATGVERGQANSRLELLKQQQKDFVSRHKRGAALTHDTVLARAVKMMRSMAAKAFDLSQEKAKVREAYGRGTFGQGCLMARRLIEQQVPFIEVSLGDQGRWDTHRDNFNTVKALSAELDAGWSMLMSDLEERGLLESTTIIWMGEFGRTPRINANGGRDHFPRAWTGVLAGGGIKGGQAYGRTSKGGTSVEDGKVDTGDVLATLCQALGIDPRKQNISEKGRPIRIAEGGVIEDVLS